MSYKVIGEIYLIEKLVGLKVVVMYDLRFMDIVWGSVVSNLECLDPFLFSIKNGINDELVVWDRCLALWWLDKVKPLWDYNVSCVYWLKGTKEEVALEGNSSICSMHQ